MIYCLTNNIITYKNINKNIYVQIDSTLSFLPERERVGLQQVYCSTPVTASSDPCGAGSSSEVERSLMVWWVVGSILHGVDPLSYISRSSQ